METSRFELFSSLISSASKSIQRIKAEKMKKYHLSAAHTACLCRLADAKEQGLTQGQLSALESMDRAQISRVLSDLLHREYVSVLDSDKQYKKRYVLTSAGSEITREIRAIILDINCFVSQAIPDEDIQIFYRTLRTIAGNLEQAVETFK